MKPTGRKAAGLARWWRRRAGTWWWAIVVIVVPVAVIAASAVTALLLFVDGGDPKNQIELIKTGLTVGAGTGGVVALVLTGRRQWSTEHDATQRRLTELYVKAVEQLGSDRAAVRHGGLYALERVAQDNPDQRQTVVNVLCAYLRTPFHIPGEPRGRRRPGIRRPLAPSPLQDRRAVSSAHGDRRELPTAAELEDNARQEHEVRLTAQRILTTHLKPGVDPDHPVDTFWADSDLDLTGAALVDLDLNGAQLRAVDFNRARFAGGAWFDGVSFTGNARFDGANFTGTALFSMASFTGNALFVGASFARDALFDRVNFAETATFDGASFAGDALFVGASFAETALFVGANFTGNASFNRASFGNALFDGVTFSGGIGVSGAQFEHGLPEQLHPHIVPPEDGNANGLD